MKRNLYSYVTVVLIALASLFPSISVATPFTETVPGTGVALPGEYPGAGGVVIVLTGVNGNIYYQFSDPDGAFVGYQNSGQPAGFRGNPFTINDPIGLNCGFRPCADYFGGALTRVDIRFSAYDGDTQPGGFDENDITLVLNGFDVGSWSGRTTDITNNSGSASFGLTTGFGNNTFNTGWFSSTNPALLSNILLTEQTVTQVRDRDPNDNYWDFTRGRSLPRPDLETIAPGYELEKTVRGGATTFSAVGEVITYDYIVGNIGSVDIKNIEVFDDKIGAVSCTPTELARTRSGTATEPNRSFCFATYVITQEDYDNQSVTNIARATGTPEFGTLGALNDTVTLTGPALAPAIVLEKVAVPQSFGAAGETIRYDFTIRNTGDTTLTNVVVTDPLIPGLSCTIAQILPISTENPTNNTATCSGSYVTDQDDVDASAAGVLLTNTATVRARDPNNRLVVNTATEAITGPAAMPALTLVKTAQVADYDAAGDAIPYQFLVTNTGNVTWPAPPVITDALGIPVSCPAGPVSVGARVTCTATYTVGLPDLDAGQVLNSATADITVNGVSATTTDTAIVPAVQTPAFTVLKELLSGPEPFAATTDQLTYRFTVRNTGNVTLSDVTVTDNKVAPNCAVGPLAPGGVLICTSDPYTIQQADLNAGQVVNTASVTANGPDGAPLAPVSASETVLADQMPALAIVKTAQEPAIYAQGQVATYTYTVTNTGNIALTDPILIRDDKFLSDFACGTGVLAPMATRVCTADYTITAADAAAGFVTNVALAVSGGTQSPIDSITIPQAGEPELVLVKAVDDANSTGGTGAFNTVGDIVAYTFTITNVGGRTISAAEAITMADALIDNNAPAGGVDCSAQPVPTLFSTQTGGGPTSFVCTGDYSVTQADINRGFIDNTATASYTFNRNGVPTLYTSPEASARVLTNVVPDFTLAKTPSSPTFTAPGESVTFTFTATNTSNQRIASVTVTDPAIPGFSCTITGLRPVAFAPQNEGSCTGVYVTTQADMDSGSFTNMAAATGVGQTGITIPERTATATITRPAAAVTRAMALTKTPSAPGYAAVGDKITYTFGVRNTGNVTLTNVAVNDADIGTTCTIPAIAPGVTNTSCTAELTVTQALIDAGSFTNTATATAAGTPPASATATVTGPVRAPAIALEKVADAPFTAKTDDVTFTLTARNTGNVTLTGVTITDSFFAPVLTCNIGALAPGMTGSCDASYTVQQSDVDRGFITNAASVTASGGGLAVSDGKAITVPGPAEVPSVAITKVDRTPDGLFGVTGSTQSYDLSVTNTGNVTLQNLQVVDAMIGLNCTIATLAPGTSTNQCTTPVQLLQGDYIVQQADVDASSLTNSASVSGQTTRGTPAVDDVSLTLTGPEQLPAVTITKSATSGANYTAVGDLITYEYVVRNTGNITLTSPISVTDDKAPVNCVQVPNTRLGVNQTISCTATYAVTQADLDDVDNDGGVTNVAFASVTQAVVPGPTYPTGSAAITSPTATVTVPADQQPAVSLVKSVTPGTAGTYDATSDVISYTFVVRNSGNVTTTAPIIVDDAALGAPLACAPAGLAPGATASCIGTWSPAQIDIDNGSFANTANASTIFDGLSVISAPSTVVVNAVQLPALETAKSFVSLVPNVYADPNVVTYRFDVTNTGNQTAVGPIQIVDNLIGTFVCDPADLAPQASISCTRTYVITQDDVRLGSVTNVAYASSPTINSPPTSETVPEGGIPALSIDKVADVSTFSAVGDPIVYTYTVRNTSTGVPAPAFADNILINDDKFPAPIECYMILRDGLASLLPGESGTCNATYFVTQDDLDAVAAGVTDGFVTNNASGQTTFGTANVVSPPKFVTVVGEALPALSVLKAVSGPNPVAVLGDPLTYTITTTNSGNQTISGVVVTDPRIPTLTCEVGGAPAPSNIVLAPGGSVICEGTYTVTQADIDAQVLDNTATASGTNPQGDTITATGTASQPVVDDQPVVTIVKSLRNPPAPGQPSFTDPGQELIFDMAVTNTGNVTLASTTVTDIFFPGDVRTIGPIAPGATDRSVSFSYIVQQADIDRGFILNEATAVSVANTPDATVVRDSDTINGQGPDREPAIALSKNVDTVGGIAPTFDGLGQQISYTYVIANLGNITLPQLPTITDDKIASVTCEPLPVGGLPPSGELTCTGIYSVTQADVDAGFVTNLARASVANPLGGAALVTPQVSATVNAERRTSLAMTKTPSITAGAQAGDLITYTYAVTNTGNVTLDNVTVTDQHTSASGTAALTLSGGGVIPTLLPGQKLDLTATYAVTQADIDQNKTLTNTATVNGTPRFGFPSPAAQTADASVTTDGPAPMLEVVKDVVLPADLVPNAEIVFPVTVTNTGNVTLRAPALTDTLTRLDTSTVVPAPAALFVGGDTGGDNLLSVNEVWTYEVRYRLTQADIDAGGISNSIRALASDLLNNPTSDISDNGINPATGSAPTIVAVPAMPAINAEKVITSTDIGLGEIVRFEIRVTNTGNVTLNTVGVASDTLTRADAAMTPLALASGPSFFGSSAGSAAGTLQVGETATYRATYVLAQDDIDAGGVTNTATVRGNPPVGSPVTDVTDNGDDADGNTVDDPTTLVIPAMPGISLVKILHSGGPTFDNVGDALTFRFNVTNTGNVTLTDPVTISDPLIANAGGAVTCDPVPLAPLASLTCEGTYVVTQADIDAGEVMNTATASAGALITLPSTVIVPALRTPALETVKEAVSITVDGTLSTDLRSDLFVVGAIVAYDYTVTNTGNTTLTTPVTVTDNLIPVVTCPVLPAGGLVPRASLVCSATFVVTATDVQIGSVTNIARASSGGVTSPLVSETVPADGVPALTTVKSLLSVTNPDNSPSATPTFDQVGDILTYQFEVTNSGTVAFANPVTVVDTRFAAPIACFVPSAGDPDLRAGETVTCVAQYTVTQADLDAADVVNEAYAETIYGADNRMVVSDPATQTTPADKNPQISIAKAATPARFAAAGETLRYTLTLTNTGNQTLTSVVARDPLLPGLSCMVPTLAVGTSEACAADYVVTQNDVDAGEVVNTASVAAVTPQGTGTSDSTSLTTPGPAAAPGLSLVKTATPTPFGAVGSAITYVMAVENTGNVTLTNVMVSDAITTPPLTCQIARLRVGATDDSCTLSLTVTQDMVDAGQITNTATATAIDPNGARLTALDSVTTPSRPAAPALDVTKVASLNGSIAGSTVDFTLFVRNTGDVTLTPVGIVDRMERLNGSTAGLVPVTFALQSGDTNGDMRIGVAETWVYRASYVLTQQDVNAGGLRNSVTFNATAPSGVPVFDVSDNGNDSDGNMINDPTEVPIVPGPALDATKVLAQGGAVAGDEVIFVVTVRNVGNVSLTDIAMIDTMTRAGAGVIAADQITITPNDPGVVSQPLAPNGQREWRVSYVLTQDDVDAGGLFNVAVVTGNDPGGLVVRDLADNGDDSDGNTVDDPTRVAIVPTPGFAVLKTAVPFADPSAVVQAGDVVSYLITISNTGNVTLSDLVLTDTMTNLSGDVIVPDSLVLKTGASETLIATGGENTYALTYTLTQDDIDAGGISNTATAAAVTPSGIGLIDISDDGDDTDGNTLDDPTVIPLGQVSSVDVNKEASVPTRVGTNLFEVIFDMTVVNTGNVTQRNLVIRDDLAAFVSPATLVSVDVPRVSGFDGSANPGFDGTSDTALLAAGANLAPQATGTIAITVVYDVTNGSPAQPNVLVVDSDTLIAAAIDTAEVPVVAAPDIFAAKSVTPETALLGGTVTYRLTFENQLSTAERGLTVIDDMPSGVVFTPGTARYNGAATPEPRIVGQQLRWENLTLAPLETVTITFDARVTGDPGELVNRAYMLGPDGNRVSNVATATLRRRPEAVFECGDVIGKVFDDRNMNGYQDGVSDPYAAEPGNNPLITDQRFDGGKYSGPPPVVLTPEHEPGLSGVRLSTVTGTLITTDEYGRFSVPCAELPAAIGSNFTLKLDERTLPTGYRVTTENPRVIRLTPGTVAKLNFGAAIANVVDIDLIGSAFGQGSEPSAALVAGVDQLVVYLQSEPSVLRLSYYMNGEGRDLARQRLDTVEAMVRDKWRANGGYRLLIERTIRQVQ